MAIDWNCESSLYESIQIVFCFQIDQQALNLGLPANNHGIPPTVLIKEGEEIYNYLFLYCLCYEKFGGKKQKYILLAKQSLPNELIISRILKTIRKFRSLR